jgi:hypothetical protein
MKTAKKTTKTIKVNFTREEKNAHKAKVQARLDAKAKTPKEPEVGVKSGMEIVVSEAVGCHFRADTATAPVVGGMILVKVTHKKIEYEIPMVVRYTRALKSGLTLVMAFIGKDAGSHGQGFHQVLGAEKGNKAQVIWE